MKITGHLYKAAFQGHIRSDKHTSDRYFESVTRVQTQLGKACWSHERVQDDCIDGHDQEGPD